MTTLEYLMCLVYSIDSEKNQRIAALIDRKSLRFLAYGVHTGDGGFQTAIVNVLQNYEYDMAKCWIIATYAPSEMCLGMAQVRALGGLAYLNSSGTIVRAIDGEEINTASFKVAEGDVPAAETLPAWNAVGAWFSTVSGLQSRRQLTRTALNPFTSINDCYNSSNLQFATRWMPGDIRTMLTTLPTDAAPPALVESDAINVYMRLACAIVGQSWTPLLQWNPAKKPGQIMGGTNIGAVMVHNNSIIGWGLNLLSRDKSFHAETIMLQSYLMKNNRTTLPTGCKIYTSLQPCRMCAGFITRVGTNVKVYYGLRDQGLTTVLTKGATNGCTEVAASSLESFGKGPANLFAKHQSDLQAERGTRTPIFLADDTGGVPNFYQQFGRNILNYKAYAAAEIEKMNKELSKVPKPGNEAEIRQRLTTFQNFQKAVEQAISLLKIVGETGMTTTYGFSILQDLFPQLKPA